METTSVTADVTADIIIDINKPEPEGTFGWYPEACNSIYLIEDAYKAIMSTNEAPEFFKHKSVDDSFMFTPQNHFIWDEIHSKMNEYDSHSGYSYAWTMRNIEHIFKYGWDHWVYTMKKNYVEQQKTEKN
jgi:hypothetical protein